jgi:simple sugar transport system ATP-binding protein
VLTPQETDQLFQILRALNARGVTIVLITHKLREIMAITDEVSVMRRGEMVATRKTKDTSVEELAELMVGRRVLLRVDKGEANPGAVKLAVENLTVRDSRGVTMVDNVSFTLRAGEIVGIAGVAGNGQSELLEAISGIRRAVSGTVLLNGKPIDVTGHADPGDLRNRGLAHVPEDRHHVGLVLKFDEAENGILGYHNDKRYLNGVFLDTKAIQADAEEKIRKYDIRPPNPRLKTANFSGGNQQKIVLAKWLATNPRLLIVDEPTRGIDVATKAEVHRLLSDLAADGVAVLMVSSELLEVLGMADRVLVMREGRLAGELSRADATEEAVMRLATGQTAEAAAK